MNGNINILIIIIIILIIIIIIIVVVVVDNLETSMMQKRKSVKQSVNQEKTIGM